MVSGGETLDNIDGTRNNELELNWTVSETCFPWDVMKVIVLEYQTRML